MHTGKIKLYFVNINTHENQYFQGHCQLSNIQSFPEKQPWKGGSGSLTMNVISRQHQFVTFNAFFTITKNSKHCTESEIF